MKDMKRAEWTVVPLALGILLVVFGALMAALLPVVLALTAFLAANGLLAVISHALHVDQSASSVMLLMGMAVGVDYCLFYLRREREERAAGRDKETALRIAAATSGRSVLISGMTVLVAMAGMFLAGMQLFAGFAVATISVVLIGIVGSVTFLLALASPVVGLHTEMLSIPQMLPASTPIVQSYDRIMTAFPGGPAPALVVVKASDIQAPAARQAIAALVGWHSPAIGQPIEVNVYPAANLAQITIPLAGSGTDATSRHALTTLHYTNV